MLSDKPGPAEHDREQLGSTGGDPVGAARQHRVGVTQVREAAVGLDPEGTHGAKAGIERVQVSAVVAQRHIERPGCYPGAAVSIDQEGGVTWLS